MNFKKNQGSALLSALFFITLISIIITALLVHLQDYINDTKNNIERDERYLASQIVFSWTKNVLSDASQANISKTLLFPKEYPNPYPHLKLSGYLIDLQSKFNLNALKNTNNPEQDKKEQKKFYTLLKEKLPKLSDQTLQALVNATHHWINDPPAKTSGLDEFYQTQKIPYFAGHQLIQNLSEFRLIKGVTPSTYKALLPYITALPQKTAINLNTASPSVLHLLHEGLSESDINTLIELREPNGIQNLEKINELLQKYQINLSDITLESDYFLCQAKISSHNHVLYHYGIFYKQRDPKTKKINPILLHNYFDYQ